MNKEKMILSRELILKKLENIFYGKAIESHIFGSIAKNNSDEYSDIDIWFTFNDADFEEIKNNRFDYYKKIGEIIHVCEPPQNAPVNGIHSALIIKDGDSLTMTDIYLCPLSTSFITKDSKKIYGLDLPINDISFNPQKVQVGEDYRVDFLICFIFNTIKKIKRNYEFPFDDVLREYNNLIEKYQIKVKPQEKQDLEQIISNIKEVSNERQIKALNEISIFYKEIF